MEALIFGSFIGLALVAFCLHQLSKKTEQQRASVSNSNFLKFQRSFFMVYFMALLGDWLQGPYVYKLYHFYGFHESDIAVLYVAGFAASVVFGTMTGPLADIIGRRKIAQLFCILYSLCCLTKLSSSFTVLLIGRLFGGISTSMLFSTFESWYVYEHNEKYGFPAEWIGVTFSITTFWNGVLAIGAGVVSNFAAETLGYGPVAPFMVAIIPLALCGLIITRTWPENYGSRKLMLAASCAEGLRQILGNRSIFLLGCIQTVIESCMYIFVFLWTPVMMPSNPPYGMVFACFMVAIMIGSSLYTILLSKGYKAEDTLRLSIALIAVTMMICVFTTGPDRSTSQISISYVAFLILEVAIGMYFPAMSFEKSQIIPENYRANVMNWFRVPMNLITCGALLCLHIDWVSDDKRIVFIACFLFTISGLFFATWFKREMEQNEKPNNFEVIDSKDAKDFEKEGLLSELA